MRRKAIYIAFIVAIIVGVFAPVGRVVWWVGFADLEVTFSATDGETGLPVVGALVEIQNSSGMTDSPERWVPTKLTSDDGLTVMPIQSQMTMGKTGLWQDTWFIAMPNWYYRGNATGCCEHEWTALDSARWQRAVQRPDHKNHRPARVTIPIILHRQAPTHR